MDDLGGAVDAQRSAALFSNEAEQSVLGALLLDNGTLDRIADLKAEHFSNDEHRAIFSVIAGELLAGRPVDVVTAFEALRAQGRTSLLGYLSQLAQAVPSAANARRYAGVVIERWRARQLMSVGMKTVELAQDAELPVGERIERVQAEVGKLSDAVAQREASPLYEAMVRHTERLEDRSAGKIRVFPTGIRELDHALGGGARPGNLIVLAGRPSMGKTAIAMTIGLNMAEDYGVGFLSMEMTEPELCDRVTANLGKIDLHDVQLPDASDGELWTRIVEATEKAGKRAMFIDDEGGLTIHQVAAKARAMKRKHGIDVLIVDYLQLMSGVDPKQPRAYQLEDICRGMKALAKSLGIAVIALAQVKRTAEGMPGLSDLKDSGAIEQDADVVAFIHRPIAADPNLGEAFALYAELGLRKNRQGPTGNINLTYIGKHTHFGPWDGPAPQKAATSGRRDHNL